MKNLFFVVWLLILSIPSNAQRQYFYIEVESQDSTKYEARFGKFRLNSERELFRDDDIEFNQEEAIAEIKNVFNQNDEKEKNVFIYIHGMWGHQEWYQRDVLNAFENDIFTFADNPPIVISFIWHSGINYWDNVHHALAVGKYFSAFFSEVINLPEVKVKVLCHSMGNRVFQGIQSQIETDNYPVPLIDEVYMIAADLEENIFQENQPLNKIGQLVKSVLIYVHNNDRSLGMSKSINDNKRLGLNGNKSICTQDSCLQIIDVSIINDNEGFGPALSNHRYFYTSPTVRNDLKLSLAGKENPDRKTLDHNRRKQLLQLNDN